MDFFVLATAYSAIVTKLVDLVRGVVDPDDKAKGWIWIVLAMIIGIAIALIYEVDYTDAIQGLPERFVSLSGVGAQILTGMAIGAYASGLHELFDALSGVASKGHAVAKGSSDMGFGKKA